MFNLTQYVETIQRQSGATAEQVVLSGNGFKDPALAPILAALVPSEVVTPPSAGLASLRGAAVYAWRALGHDAMPHAERLLDSADRIAGRVDTALRERYAHFKQLRETW
jgi:sugar (pentulose or hexulose) kinase